MTTTRRSVLALGTAMAATLAAPTVIRAQAAPIRLVLSHHLPTTHIGHRSVEQMAERIKTATNGQVMIDIRPASQLFNLRTSAEAIQLGTLDLCWSDLGTLANWHPFFGFVSLPFLFSDFDHVKRVLYGATGEQVVKSAKELLNIEILSLGASGFRCFLSKKPVQTADDVRGIKLRVPEIPTWVEMAKALGANPTPIPAGEMYTALQTGVIDAIEVPADYISTAKLYEVAPFITRTHHIFTEVSLMASAKKMATLPPDVQKVIRDEAKRAVADEMWVGNIKEQQLAWDAVASKIKANATPDIPSFRAKMGVVNENFIKRSGPKAKELVEATQAAGRA